MGVYLLDEFLNSFGAGRIRLVTLCFGANDASLPNGPSGWMSVPLPEYRANLVAMVKRLRDKGINNIIIMTPPPINDGVQVVKVSAPLVHDELQRTTARAAGGKQSYRGEAETEQHQAACQRRHADILVSC
jgi:lysophospholipase L1-like esterase